jgi:hypothetical protein
MGAIVYREIELITKSGGADDAFKALIESELKRLNSFKYKLPFFKKLSSYYEWIKKYFDNYTITFKTFNKKNNEYHYNLGSIHTYNQYMHSMTYAGDCMWVHHFQEANLSYNILTPEGVIQLIEDYRKIFINYYHYKFKLNLASLYKFIITNLENQKDKETFSLYWTSYISSLATEDTFNLRGLLLMLKNKLFDLKSIKKQKQ